MKLLCSGMRLMLEKHVAKHIKIFGFAPKKADLCVTNLKQSFLP